MKAKILVLILTLLANITLISQPLSIEIKLDKEEYLIYEPIILIIEITNETNYPISIKFGFYNKDFKLNVINNGKEIKCGDVYITGANPLPITLESEGSLITSYKLLTIFGCTNSERQKGLFLEHLIADNYTVELEYNFGKEVLNDNEDLIVKSNKLEFTVKEPKNEVYQTQLKQFIDLMKKYKEYDDASFESRIEKIIELDKRSPYSLLAQYRLITRTRAKSKGKTDKYQKLMEKACLDFPNSFVSLTYAMFDKTILDKMADNKELKGNIIQKYSKKVKESRAKIKYAK